MENGNFFLQSSFLSSAKLLYFSSCRSLPRTQPGQPPAISFQQTFHHYPLLVLLRLHIHLHTAILPLSAASFCYYRRRPQKRDEVEASAEASYRASATAGEHYGERKTQYQQSKHRIKSCRPVWIFSVNVRLARFGWTEMLGPCPGSDWVSCWARGGNGCLAACTVLGWDFGEACAPGCRVGVEFQLFFLMLDLGIAPLRLIAFSLQTLLVFSCCSCVKTCVDCKRVQKNFFLLHQ